MYLDFYQCAHPISHDKYWQCVFPSQILNLVQSYVTVRVPLFVSYVFHSPVAVGGWQHFDLQSELKLTFVYDTAILWQDGIGSPPEAELQGVFSGALCLLTMTYRFVSTRVKRFSAVPQGPCTQPACASMRRDVLWSTSKQRLVSVDSLLCLIQVCSKHSAFSRTLPPTRQSLPEAAQRACCTQLPACYLITLQHIFSFHLFLEVHIGVPSCVKVPKVMSANVTLTPQCLQLVSK